MTAKPAHSLLILLASAVAVIAGCGKTLSGDSMPSAAAGRPMPPIPADVSAAVKERLEALQSPDPLQRAYAAVLLDKMGKQARPAVPFLLVALDDQDRQVRGDAAGALGRIGDPRAVEPLVGIVQNTDEDWEVRAAAAASLGELGDRRATGPLIAALAAMVSHVRYKAAVALGRIGDPAAKEALESTAALDSDLSVRYAAKDALGRISPGGEPAAGKKRRRPPEDGLPAS